MSRRLYVEPLMSDEEIAVWTTDEERRTATSFGAEQRRREWLSWRAVVRRELGRETTIAYNEQGAPCIVGGELHLSVSHARDRVAVLLSEEPCGVDLERTDRRFERVKSKYLTADEELLSDDPRFRAVAWSAKEALYKYAGEEGLSFTEDIRILAFSGEELTAQIKKGEELRLTICYPEEGYVVAYL